MTLASREERPDRHATDELHEIAHVERLLRADDRPQEPLVQVGRNGARISWETWIPNGHSRGSLTASVVNEIAATDAWGVATIHDPLQHVDMMQSMLTIVYDGQEARNQ